jgi:ureidoglycolate hydrolase
MGLWPHFLCLGKEGQYISYTRRLWRHELYTLCFVLYYLISQYEPRNRIRR